jgi:ribosomal protein S12 methylthiotransferase
MKKICFITLGCPKNIVDTERIMSAIDKSIFKLTTSAEDSDILLLNTCGFMQSAIDESYAYISEIQNLKKHNPTLTIVVYGCLVSRFATQHDQLTTRFPLVDKFLPLMTATDLLSIVTNSDNTNNTTRSELLASQHYAYLKISDGCDRKCAFCTIPSIKGKYISTPPNELIAEAKQLADANIKEIILIGQETTCYGKDINTNFVQLLDSISQIQNLRRIRIMYAHPNSVDTRIFSLMKERPNICKYIDIPLQHISNNILTAMKRGTPADTIKHLIDTMRQTVPNIHIRSTFIVGFPGETDADYLQLKNFLKEYELDRVGIFKYSAEPDTVAYNLPNQVPNEIKEERLAELMEQQQSISLSKNKSIAGQKINVLIEEKLQDGNYYGRTEFDAPDIDNGVIIKKRKSIKIGEIQTFTIKNYSEYDLYC